MQLIWMLLIFCFSTVLGSRILNGIEAEEGEIPWQVSIQTSEGLPFCGASIIAPEYIMTIRRCKDQFWNLTLADFRIVVGTLRYDTPGSIHGVTEMITHPEADISIWKISPPFLYDDKIKPVYLPDEGTHTPPGTNLTFSGWGTTSSSGNTPEVLLIGEGPVISNAECDAIYSSIVGGIDPGEMCVGYPEGGVGFCYGDKGGPLMRNRVQRGIAAWAIDCGAGEYPPIFLEVSNYRNWIAQVAGV